MEVLFKCIQGTFDGDNILMNGEEVKWNPTIIVGEEEIKNTNNVKGASKSSYTNTFLMGYIENHGYRV